MKVLFYLIIILLTPTLILLNFRSLVFNHDFYVNEFTKLNVYKNFESKELVNSQGLKLIKYYCCSGKLDDYFYTQREQAHLMDVKKLIQLVNFQTVFFSISLLIISSVLIIRKKFILLLKSYQIASVVTLVALFITFLGSVLNFDLFFTKFHTLSFQNNLWLLSNEANLIKLFPQQFFIDFTNRVAYQTIVTAVIILLITFLALKYNDSK